MLHKDRVMTMVYWGTRRRLRLALRLPKINKAPPVLSQSTEAVVQRHGAILKTFQENFPNGLDLTGKTVCEVGSGDCLAVASLCLGLGAKRVEIVEIYDPVVNPKQLEVLSTLRAQGFPVDLTILRDNGTGLKLDTTRVGYNQCFMENFRCSTPIDFMFSFSVMEHVEDLDGFYKVCASMMAPNAQMVHVTDLGGHELFEDPTPPLDFQTYPNWLYSLMCPRYYRATRRFLDEHVAAVERNGFRIVSVKPHRVAEAGYLDTIWPSLRSEAQSRPRKDVAVIEFTLTAQKLT